MTALPRSPIDVPASPIHAQNAASGRHSQNRLGQPSGLPGEDGAASNFSNVLGKLAAQPKGSVDQKTTPSEADLETDLNPISADQLLQSGAGESGPSDTLRATDVSHSTAKSTRGLDLSFQQSTLGGGLQQIASGAKSGVATTTLPVSTPDKLAGAMRPEASQTQAVQNALTDETVLRADRLQTPAGDGTVLSARGEGAGLQANAPAQAVAALVNRGAEPGRPETSRAALSTARTDGPLSVSDQSQTQSDLGVDAAQLDGDERPRLDVLQKGEQMKPAAVHAEPGNSSPSTQNATGVSTAATPGQSSINAEGSSDQPRLQDVKVVSTKITEIAPMAGERTGQALTVKVIDLQLQPDTLGRIGAQIKQTGGGLEVRLEPTMAETAALLKEDRMALQRILGAFGSLSETAIVRIVDPIAEQKLDDGQDLQADSDLGETNHSGGQSTTSGGLQGEGYGTNQFENTQSTAEQSPLDTGPQRASGDIYI